MRNRLKDGWQDDIRKLLSLERPVPKSTQGPESPFGSGNTWRGLMTDTELIELLNVGVYALLKVVNDFNKGR